MKDLLRTKEKFMIERGWDKLPPGDLAKSIMIEGAELLELFQWVNPSSEEVIQDTDKMDKVKKELADILIYALDLAITLNIDPEKIILDKIKSNEQKFPAKRMVEDGWFEEYLKIKQDKREKSKLYQYEN